MAKRTILLLDDNPNVRLTVEILLNNDYNCLTAKRHELAVELYENTPGIELLICDINLNDYYSGIDFYKYVRKKDPFIQFIYFSAEENNEYLKKMIVQARSGRYFHKPFQKEELLNIVKVSLMYRDILLNLQAIAAKDPTCSRYLDLVKQLGQDKAEAFYHQHLYTKPEDDTAANILGTDILQAVEAAYEHTA